MFYSQPGDMMVLKRSDGKDQDPRPMFSFILRKNIDNEKRASGKDMLNMHDDDTVELEERGIPLADKILHKAAWNWTPETKMYKRIFMRSS